MQRLAQEINEKLKELEEVKQYLHYKSLMQKEDIQQLLKKIEETQKKMNTLIKQGKIKEYNQQKEILAMYKEEYDNNPVIINYLSYEKEVKEILEQVKKIIIAE